MEPDALMTQVSFMLYVPNYDAGGVATLNIKRRR